MSECSDDIENDLILINKNIQKSIKGTEGDEENSKKQNYSVYSDRSEKDEYLSDDEPFSIENIDEFTERKNAKKKFTRHQILEINKMVKVSEKEKKIFSEIDDILEIFQKNFPKYSQEQILDVFQKNSFDLENSYLELIDFRNFESKIFKILLIFFRE